MTRTFLDYGLRRWEVFANTGAHGFPQPGRLVFRCVSQFGVPSRMVDVAGDKSDAERMAKELTDAELRSRLSEAAEVPHSSSQSRPAQPMS